MIFGSQNSGLFIGVEDEDGITVIAEQNEAENSGFQIPVHHLVSSRPEVLAIGAEILTPEYADRVLPLFDSRRGSGRFLSYCFIKRIFLA